jgi:lysophospholipase L1-like esterase
MKSRVFAVLCVLAACFVFVAPAWATKYVALGDSYSSGTGTRTYYDSNCQRSVYSYPYLLHNAHPSWTFVQAACSGAKTGDVLNTQSSSLTSDTNWVTYTIGGNDAGFSSVITTCAAPSWASDCNGAIDNAQAYIQNTLPGRLDLVNNSIKSHSPSAKVIVLDYPRLFNGEDCNAGTWFSPSEETRLNQTADMLKGVLSAAATRA